MKKVLLWAVCGFILMGAVQVNAQEVVTEQRAAAFSPGLLSSPVGMKTQKEVKVKRVVKKSRTTVLRFDAEQTSLTDAQKEILYKIAERIADGKTKVVTVIAASTEQGNSARRAIAVDSFLKGYGKGFQYYVRFIRPENVVPSVNDTVKIIERN